MSEHLNQSPETHVEYIIHYITATGDEMQTEQLTLKEYVNKSAALILEDCQIDWVQVVEV